MSQTANNDKTLESLDEGADGRDGVGDDDDDTGGDDGRTMVILAMWMIVMTTA